MGGDRIDIGAGRCERRGTAGLAGARGRRTHHSQPDTVTPREIHYRRDHVCGRRGRSAGGPEGRRIRAPWGPSLLLDLHVPDGPGPFPAAILVHGGGFDGGGRATNMAPTFQPLADAGFAWFSIDYRMAPEFRFPEAREDIDAAIKWVKANARTYRINPAKMCWPANRPAVSSVNYAATHATPATKVAAVVDIYGPVDYEKIARQRQAYPARFNMTSINSHQKTGGGIWFFGVDGYDEASFVKLRAISRCSPSTRACRRSSRSTELATTRSHTSSRRCCATRSGRSSSPANHHRRSRRARDGLVERRRPAAYKAGMVSWLKKTLALK